MIDLASDTRNMLIEELDGLRRRLHAQSDEAFNGDPSDPAFCDKCKRANAIAGLRRKVYMGDV